MSTTVPIPIDLDSDMELWRWVGVALTDGHEDAFLTARTREAFRAYCELMGDGGCEPVGEGVAETLNQSLLCALAWTLVAHSCDADFDLPSAMQAMTFTLGACFRAAYDSGPGWLCEQDDQ